MEVVRCEDEREDTTLEDKHLLFAGLSFGKLNEDFEIREVDYDPAADDGDTDDEESTLHEAVDIPDHVYLAATVKRGPGEEIREDEEEAGAELTRPTTSTMQPVTYTEEEKKEAYRKFIMKNGTPEQIEQLYKMKQMKTYIQQKEEKKRIAARQRVHVRICVVPTCTNRTDDENITFFLVPRDNIEIRQAWELALSTQRKPYVLPRHGLICQNHFQQDQIKRKQTGKFGLVKGTVPRLDLPRDREPKGAEGGGETLVEEVPPLFTSIKREQDKILRAECTMDDPFEEPVPPSVANPKTAEDFEAFGKAIVAQVEKHVASPHFPDLLRDIMNGLKLGKVVSTKMYDRWLACERRINVLNTMLAEAKQKNAVKGVEKKKSENALLAENGYLKAKVKRYEEKTEKLQETQIKKKDLPTYIHEHLKPHLTLGQVKAMVKGNWKRSCRITLEDYQRAKTLLDISPKAYEFLRRTKQLPLPSQSGLKDYHTKHHMDLATHNAVSSIQDAEVMVQSGDKLEQLASLAAIKQEPYRCVKCVGGVCDSTGATCMPPAKKRKGGKGAKKGGGGPSPAKKRKAAAAKAQHVVVSNSSPPKEIIMHQPQLVHTEVRPSTYVYQQQRGYDQPPYQQQYHQQHYQ